MTFERENISYLRGDEIAPCNNRKQNVEVYASRVAKELNYSSPDDLEGVINSLGGTIHFHNLEEWLGEKCSIFVHGDRDFDIVLPVHTSPRRDNFTICHELGHYLLHSQQGEVAIIAHRSGSTRIEWEANWFAASFLMPQDKFRDLVQSGTSIESIAVHFGVSNEAASIRAKSLNV